MKRISEHIWDKPAPYSSDMIAESKVMKGLWMFVSYCEAYYEDCVLVKRAHLNLYLIIQIFQNILNNSLKAKHKNSFKKQRLSMLPQVCFPPHTQGNNTANTFSDRMSMISGTPLGEPHSDTE